MPLYHENSQSKRIPLRVIKECLERHAKMLEGSANGFYFADDSLIETMESTWDGRGNSWRMQTFPRLFLLLSGEHTITFVRRGHITSEKLKPGDMLFFPPDTHDREFFSTPCVYIAVVFHETITRFVLATCIHENRGKGNRERLISEWMHWNEPRPPALDAVLSSLASTLRTEFSDEQKTRAGLHLARASWLLIYDWVLQSHTERRPLSKAHASWLSIDGFLQENYHRPINRKIAAQTLGLHPTRISVLCARFMNKSFQKILEERRLRQAIRFLEESNHKIESISVLCGYVSAAYFSRTFRRATGITPGHWRLTHRKDAGKGLPGASPTKRLDHQRD